MLDKGDYRRQECFPATKMLEIYIRIIDFDRYVSVGV